MEKLFNKLPLFLNVMVEGIRFWAQTPLHFKIKVKEIKNGPYPITRLEKIKLPDDKYDFVKKTTMSDENLLAIDILVPDSNYFDSIVVNKKTKKIHRIINIMRPDHTGSGMIGVVLFSLPVVVIVLPYIFAARLYYKAIEKTQKISRYDRALFLAIQDQLDPETKNILMTAIQNSWQTEQYLRTKMSFEEAKQFLSKQHLVVCTHLIKTYTNDGFLEVIQQNNLDWFDSEGNRVASVFYPHENGDEKPYITILGSCFTQAEQIKELLECHKTMELKTEVL